MSTAVSNNYVNTQSDLRYMFKMSYSEILMTKFENFTLSFKCKFFHKKRSPRRITYTYTTDVSTVENSQRDNIGPD